MARVRRSLPGFTTVLIFTATLAFGAVATARAESPELRGPYFGQPLPGRTAEVFAPDVLSVTGRYEYALGFAPDGQPGCWQDTRWTGVLEKRDGRWVIMQMHFSFAADGASE